MGAGEDAYVAGGSVVSRGGDRDLGVQRQQVGRVDGHVSCAFIVLVGPASDMLTDMFHVRFISVFWC